MSHGASSRPRATETAAGTRAARWAFLAYALAVAIATHWPRLRIDLGAVPRPDLVIHLGVFGLWAFLCARAAWFGPRFSARNILGAGLVGVAYAGLDEATQAIEIVHRTARWDDLAADIMGVAGGLGATLLLGALEANTDD